MVKECILKNAPFSFDSNLQVGPGDLEMFESAT